MGIDKVAVETFSQVGKLQTMVNRGQSFETEVL